MNIVEQEYRDFLAAKDFPCIAAKAALAKDQVHCFVAGHFACPSHDQQIIDFLYKFVDVYRSADTMYHSAAIIFTAPEVMEENMFDRMLWNRLQSLSDIDAQRFGYDPRVSADPASSGFSFSLKEEAFFVIGLHPGSTRAARRFRLPVLTFNPHQQFEHLRSTHKYEPMKAAVRKRDLTFHGSVNPMLRDFGESSEVYQYSGKTYDEQWECPLNIHHEHEHNSTP